MAWQRSGLHHGLATNSYGNMVTPHGQIDLKRGYPILGEIAREGLEGNFLVNGSMKNLTDGRGAIKSGPRHVVNNNQRSRLF